MQEHREKKKVQRQVTKRMYLQLVSKMSLLCLLFVVSVFFVKFSAEQKEVIFIRLVFLCLSIWVVHKLIIEVCVYLEPQRYSRSARGRRLVGHVNPRIFERQYGTKTYVLENLLYFLQKEGSMGKVECKSRVDLYILKQKAYAKARAHYARVHSLSEYTLKADVLSQIKEKEGYFRVLREQELQYSEGDTVWILGSMLLNLERKEKKELLLFTGVGIYTQEERDLLCLYLREQVMKKVSYKAERRRMLS